MGGRVAEELIFGSDHVTTGASSDLQSTTELAQYMVSSCGMSDAIGPVHIKERPGSEMQSRIDAEVVKLLRDAYERMRSLLKKHEKSLHTLANALLEYETTKHRRNKADSSSASIRARSYTSSRTAARGRRACIGIVV